MDVLPRLVCNVQPCLEVCHAGLPGWPAVSFAKQQKYHSGFHVIPKQFEQQPHLTQQHSFYLTSFRPSSEASTNNLSLRKTLASTSSGRFSA